MGRRAGEGRSLGFPEAGNPGRWTYHCHNIYHAEVGMMTPLQY